MGAPYIYDISHLTAKQPTKEPKALNQTRFALAENNTPLFLKIIVTYIHKLHKRLPQTEI